MELGFSLPTPSMHFPLREALRGARRFLSRPTQQKLPIFPSLLMSLIGGTEWGSSMRCLYLTLWFTLSRLASLIPTLPSAVFDPRAHLSWGNVHFEPSGVRIILEKTKTIQCFEKIAVSSPNASKPKHLSSYPAPPFVCSFTPKTSRGPSLYLPSSHPCSTHQKFS